MKVLFVVSDFDMGGITSSLRNLSNELVERGNSVSILNLPMAKKLPDGFNSNIEIIEISGISKLWNLTSEKIDELNILIKPFFLCIGGIKKLLNRAGVWNKIVFSGLNIPDTYDLAIGFRQSPVDYYIAKYKASAKKKIGFYHVDPDSVGDTSSWDSCLMYMDIIAGVSDATCECLIRHYPALKGKLHTVYNIFDVKTIKQLATEYTPQYKENTINIVTVSRIDFSQKKLQRIPEICRNLVKDGFKLNWTIVGDGPDKIKLEKLVYNNGLEDTITIVGSKSNPYPYIQNADLFVLTSSWESYGMVVMESLILGVPVVAGDYPALKEILGDCYGIRAENSSYGIYKAISKILSNEELYNELKKNCEKFEYSADKTYEQFLNLCEE